MLLRKLSILKTKRHGQQKGSDGAKELSLGGVQRPIGPDELPDSFVEWFRFGDFAGWIFAKD